MQQLQPEQFEFAEQEEWSQEGEWSQAENEYAYESWQGEAEASYEPALHEADEMELAAELLEINNEAELDQFLGKLIRRVGSGIGRIVKSPIGRALGGVLKPLAKAALPMAGRAVGTFFGGPVGAAIGGQLGSAAGRLFGLELEGLSPEDREYEVARRFVRFASNATANALEAPSSGSPETIVKAATAKAARRIIPANAARIPAPSTQIDLSPTGSRNRGTWIRRGRRIILFGV